MASEHVERKLAAILAADVVGYSKLAGADEERTLARLRALRSDLIDPTISVHHGRVVKRTGDGTLIEFRSVVEAVRCAIEVQNGMIERNAGLPPERRIEFRVGIHVGDVMVESDGDLMGDGVNVAARIEPLAEPGGICLSQAAYEQVRDKVPYRFEDIGSRELKNIARPTPLFALSAAAIAARKEQGPSERPPLTRRGISKWKALVAACGVTLLSAGGLVWYSGSIAKLPVLSTPTDAGFPAPRLSLLVLPFANLSGDPEQEFFADGITDDLTTDLSRLPDSFVIARNTAFTYKGKAVDLKQLGRELNVRYILEGSVRRVGEKISANAQLIATDTGAHVWADRFDGERSRLGELQVEFVARLARSLDLELNRAESLRALRERPNNPDAVDLTMRGRTVYYKLHAAANMNEAIGYFERAVQLEPQLPQALLGLSEALSDRANSFWSANPAADIDRADALVSRVLSAQPDNARAHLVKSYVYFWKRQWDLALAETEDAIAEDRNLPEAYAQAGFYKLFLGHAAEGFSGPETALRLSPRDPARYLWEYQICHMHAHLAQWDQAIEWCRKSSTSNSSVFYPYVDLAAAYGSTGRDAEARIAVVELQKLTPGFTVQKFLSFKYSDNATFLGEYRRIAEGLRKAGVPES